MAEEQDIQPVVKLLLDLFKGTDLRLFLDAHMGDLAHNLPGDGASNLKVAQDAVDLLKRRGELGEDFFEAVARVRPGREGEILATATVWLSGEERLPEGPLPGTNFEIKALVGVGGSCEVYRAYNKFHERTVALKVMRWGWASPDETERTKRRLHQEAAILKRLQHPAVVEIYDVGWLKTRVYLELELVNEGSLAERVARVGHIELRQAVAWMIDVLHTLEAVHERGVIHRDIKPDNLLLSGDRLRICDFGIALDLDAATRRTSTARATPGFEAPELRRNEPATPATDVYGVAATLVHIATGKAVHDLEHAEELAALTAGWPAELVAIVERATHYRPAQRTPTARDFADALAGWLEPGVVVPEVEAAVPIVAPASPRIAEPDPIFEESGVVTAGRWKWMVAGLVGVVLLYVGMQTFWTETEGQAPPGDNPVTIVSTDAGESPPAEDPRLPESEPTPPKPEPEEYVDDNDLLAIRTVAHAPTARVDLPRAALSGLDCCVDVTVEQDGNYAIEFEDSDTRDRTVADGANEVVTLRRGVYSINCSDKRFPNWTYGEKLDLSGPASKYNSRVAANPIDLRSTQSEICLFKLNKYRITELETYSSRRDLKTNKDVMVRREGIPGICEYSLVCQ